MKLMFPSRITKTILLVLSEFHLRLKLTNPGGTLYMNDGTSSNIKPTDEIKSPQSVYFAQIFAHKNQIPLRTNQVLKRCISLGLCKTHSKHFNNFENPTILAFVIFWYTSLEFRSQTIHGHSKRHSLICDSISIGDEMFWVQTPSLMIRTSWEGSQTWLRRRSESRSILENPPRFLLRMKTSFFTFPKSDSYSPE